MLLRGWQENKSRLRVAMRSPEVWFSGFCTVDKAEGEQATFWIGATPGKTAIGFLLAGCRFRFGDVPTDAPDAFLPVGGKVESGLIGTRKDFEIAILLLKDGSL